MLHDRGLTLTFFVPSDVIPIDDLLNIFCIGLVLFGPVLDLALDLFSQYLNVAVDPNVLIHVEILLWIFRI